MKSISLPRAREPRRSEIQQSVFLPALIEKCDLHQNSRDPEKMMDKIECVFEAFREKQDVVLVWRPHPLLKETLKSMCKAHLERYIMIENTYKNQGWGIYDDSSDMYRAIVWSDAYYGDGGSVAEIYRITGKPVMLQKMNIQ